MSMTHTLSRALGAATLTATLALAAPAVAEQQRPVETRSDGSPRFRMVEEPAAQSADEPPPTIAASRRSITSKVVQRDANLYLRGDVSSYSGRQVAVQRRGCESCRWRLHDVTRTNREGEFRSRIAAPRHGSTYWRAKVAASNGYATSFSVVWETYYH